MQPKRFSLLVHRDKCIYHVCKFSNGLRDFANVAVDQKNRSYSRNDRKNASKTMQMFLLRLLVDELKTSKDIRNVLTVDANKRGQ